MESSRSPEGLGEIRDELQYTSFRVQVHHCHDRCALNCFFKAFLVIGGVVLFWSNYSDLTRPHPKWWFSKGNPLISGTSRLVKYYNLARLLVCCVCLQVC